MKGEIPLQKMSRIAGADLSSCRYCGVKIDADGNVVLAGAGENVIGVLQNSPKLGQAAEIMVLGESFIVYGASITAGNNLSVDANGKFVPTAGQAAVIAVASESGSADEVHSAILINRVSAGNNQHFVLSVPVKLANIAAATDILTGLVLGFPGQIKKLFFVVTVPVTTADKSAVINLEIGTTNLTGGVLTLNSANCTPLGAVIDATAITGNNTFTSVGAISLEAGAVTTFIEGEGFFGIVIG